MNSTNYFIKCLNKAIGPGMIDGGLLLINLVFCNESVDLMLLE